MDTKRVVVPTPWKNTTLQVQVIQEENVFKDLNGFPHHIHRVVDAVLDGVSLWTLFTKEAKESVREAYIQTIEPERRKVTLVRLG